jgi:TRAP-type uncharacterized transport system fused permease subunit
LFRALVLASSLAVSLFTLYTAIFGLLTPVLQRSIHIALILVIAFFLFPLKQKNKLLRLIDYLSIVLIIASEIYLYIIYGSINERIGYVSLWDIVFGVIYIVLVLEALP